MNDLPALLLSVLACVAIACAPSFAHAQDGGGDSGADGGPVGGDIGPTPASDAGADGAGGAGAAPDAAADGNAGEDDAASFDTGDWRTNDSAPLVLDEGTTGGEEGAAPLGEVNLWPVLGWTALLVAAMVGLLVLVRRLVPGAGAPGGGDVQVLARTSLGPRHHVFLLRAGGRVLVVGTTPQSIASLADVTDPEEADRATLASNRRDGPADGHSREFRDALRAAGSGDASGDEIRASASAASESPEAALRAAAGAAPADGALEQPEHDDHHGHRGPMASLRSRLAEWRR